MTDLSLAARSARVLYLATLVAIIFPRALLGAGSWVGLATGGGIAMLGLYLLPILGLAAWRFIYVVRNPQALASPPDHPVAASIRGIGLLLMAISVLTSVAQFFVGPIARLLFGPHGGEAGVGYFVVGLYLYLASGVALLALLLFEFGRWLARRAENVELQTRRRIAVATLGPIALLGVAWFGARTYVQSGERALLAHCGALAEPVVKRQLAEAPTSFLLQEYGPRELPVPIFRPATLAGASGLAFIESCNPGLCTKLTPPAPGSLSPPHTDALPSPTSPIELGLGSVSIEKSYLGARLLRLRYEIRTTATHEVLAAASEWVYDWGRWKRANRTSKVQRMDACGYAQAAVHPFRSNVLVSVDATGNAYTAADVRFLLSVVPRAMQPAAAAKNAEMLSPGRQVEQPVYAGPPPQTGPIETVVSESTRGSNRTLPALPGPPQRSALVEDSHGPVRLRSQLGGTISGDGLTLQHCCAGALSLAFATHAAPAGTSYMEAMFIAEDGHQAAGAWTTLGVGAASSARDNVIQLLRNSAPTRTLKSGDIVGVLIDTDRRRVEFSVKGQRVSVRDLYDLRTTELALWVAVSAGHGGGAADRWVVNFGAAPFVYPPGEPVLTYEGRIARR